MSKFLYKYVGPSYLANVFAIEDHVTLKCSFPEEFNDPYELFLTIDFNEPPEVLAFYADAVGEIPQLPTTCFSHSPGVIPMWAHYGQNLQGFCIEFDEKLMSQYFPKSTFEDVDYRDETKKDLTDMLYRAYEIGKYRYIYFLHNMVFSAAYFSKASHWNYEQERRMIVKDSEIRKSENFILIDVPMDCVSSFICGSRASKDTIDSIRKIAKKFECNFFKLKIGRTSPTPYFLDAEENSFIFTGAEIVKCENYCQKCKEPISNDTKKCSWCQITELDKREAALRNSYRMLAQFGLLDEYIAGMDAISKGENDINA